MNKGLLILIMLALSACSRTPETSYYHLPTNSFSHPVTTKTNTNDILWVENVSLADILAGNGLVYQSSEVKYVVATGNLWAGSLEQQLRQTLISNLSFAMPQCIVSDTQLGEKQNTLNISVEGFHGRYDGKVVLKGRWMLQHHATLIQHPFEISLPQTEDGYGAMVKTLADGWQKVAQQVAAELMKMSDHQ